jgi:hypothetical protein
MRAPRSCEEGHHLMTINQVALTHSRWRRLAPALRREFREVCRRITGGRGSHQGDVAPAPPSAILWGSGTHRGRPIA